MKILNKIKSNIKDDFAIIIALSGVSSDKKNRIYLKWGVFILIIILIIVFLVFCAVGCKKSGKNNKKEIATIGFDSETKKETESETMPSTEETTEEETLTDDTASAEITSDSNLGFGSNSNSGSKSSSSSGSGSGSVSGSGSGSSSNNHLNPPKPVQVPSDKDNNVLPSNKYPENGTWNEDDRPEPTKAPQENPDEDLIIIVRPSVTQKETETEKTIIQDDMDNPYGDDELPQPVKETETQTNKETQAESQTENVNVQFRRVDGAGIINVSITPSGSRRNVVGFWVYPDGSTRAASSTTNGYRIIYKFGIDYSAVKLIVRVDSKEFSYKL